MSEDASGVEPESEEVTDDESEPDVEESTVGGPTVEESTVVEDVAAYDEDLAADVQDLRDRVEHLEAELDDREERIDDLESTLKRTQADFQNYKKRAQKRQEKLKERAAEDFVERVVPVRDDLIRALEQDEDANIREGVESIVEKFDRVLDAENVTPIEPEPGDDVDPRCHQVMMRVESDQPEGTVVDVYRPGYEMGETIIQEAQVTVSETGDDGESDDDGDHNDANETDDANDETAGETDSTS